MSIELQCNCGKVLKARDEHAGRQARCPSCKQLLFIPAPVPLQEPEPLQLEPGDDDGHRGLCPNCSEPIRTGAIVCMHCGYNTKTGKVTATSLQPAARTRGLSFAFPVKQVVAAAVVLVVLGVGWFCVAAPILAKLNVGSTVGYVTNGDLQEALDEFQALRPKVSGGQRERVDLWISQLELELEKNTGPVLSKGKLVTCEAVRMKLAKRQGSGGAVLFNIELLNHGTEALTVRNDHFYIRGLSDIVLVANHADNSFDEVLIPPGESREGLVAFRKMPDHPVRRQIGRQQQTAYYLMFNDGEHYVKGMLPF